MAGVCIVAIPADTDTVWQVSSEASPHMTVLFLGENIAPDALDRIEDHVATVTDEMLTRFWASVSKRGPLGPEGADVAFLEGPDLDVVARYRARLLQHPDIKAAYDSVKQYPKWTPHVLSLIHI